eukprot:359009-Chlamydomonas_euryale.AAC.1
MWTQRADDRATRVRSGSRYANCELWGRPYRSAPTPSPLCNLMRVLKLASVDRWESFAGPVIEQTRDLRCRPEARRQAASGGAVMAAAADALGPHDP